jgi:ABC-type nitrate/sulfonate/bicarbonate transport system permease component
MTTRSERLPWSVLPATPTVILLILWAACWQIERPPPSVIPPVLAMFVAFGDVVWSGGLLTDILAGLARLLGGVTLGVVTGMIVGFVAGLTRPIAPFLNPLVAFFNAISGIVWLPSVIGWPGVGGALSTFLIWNTVFFIVFQTTCAVAHGDAGQFAAVVAPCLGFQNRTLTLQNRTLTLMTARET